MAEDKGKDGEVLPQLLSQDLLAARAKAAGPGT